MKKQNVRTLGLIICTFTYLLIGAAVFDAIESEEEKRQKEALEKLESQMLSKYNITLDDFAMLEEVIHLYKPFHAGKPWQFAGSFYYATTVLTTIGYGHSTPKTQGGKFFTMIYAMIGIPLGLVMFNSIGERLNNFSSIVINKVRRMTKAKQPETTEMDLICVVTTLSGLIVTTGAAAFSHYEGWTYFDSIYYCFVTLTTIGFGDLVALQQDNSLGTKPEYVTFALFFIMFGLAIIAAWLNLMVLKFMTMNTEDEKRDEQQAIQAAAHNVRLDGDIILQRQSEVLQWQAEGAGSLEDVRSVCSCTCNTCNPFQQINRRLEGSREWVDLMETAVGGGGGASSTRSASRWQSRESRLSSLSGSPPPRPPRRPVSVARILATPTDGCHCHFYSHSSAQTKAESLHDLRRSAVSSALKLPPNTPPRCPSARGSRYGRSPRSPAFTVQSMDNSLLATAAVSVRADNSRTSLLSRFFHRGSPSPQDENYVVEERLDVGGLEDDDEEAIRVVPMDENINCHKRISL